MGRDGFPTPGGSNPIWAGRDREQGGLVLQVQAGGSFRRRNEAFGRTYLTPGGSPFVCSLGFDPFVENYDRTRTVDTRALSEALDAIVDRYPPERCPRVIDAGVGTGRIAFPLVKRGYSVFGVDISRPMLAGLRQKERNTKSGRPVQVALADVAALPFRGGSFDFAIATHLFYFVAKWREAARELLRMTSRHGAVILLQTGTGREVPEVHQRYREIAKELGFDLRAVGLRGVGVESSKEVLSFYQSEGHRIQPDVGRWGWVERIPAIEALENLLTRTYSWTMPVPEETHRAIIAKLREEIARSHPPGHLFEVENEVRFSVVDRS
jgi:ubiquinone/menaquinone biosynthesis C-methylase UbiE